MRTIGIMLFIVVVIPIGLYLKKKQMERTNKYGTTVHDTFGDFIKTTIWEKYVLNIIGLAALVESVIMIVFDRSLVTIIISLLKKP